MTYNLPLSYDPEGLNYTVSLIAEPTFISLIASSQIRINPPSQAFVGNYTLRIKLEDQEPKSSIYSILISVIQTSQDLSYPKEPKLLMNSIVY